MTRWLSSRSRLVPALAALALGAGILPANATAAEPQPPSRVDAMSQVEGGPEVASASSLVPFACEPVLYQSAKAGSSQYLFRYTLNGTTGFTLERIGDAYGRLNGMGYNTRDNYIYGNIEGNLVRLGSNGAIEVVDNAAGLSGHNSGDFWGPDILISAPATTNNWKKIDLTNPDNPQVSNFTLSGTTYTASDIAILGNTAYAIHDNGSGLFVIDLLQQTIRMKSLTGLSGPAGGFGAAFADSLGNLFFHRNGGHVWRILATDLAKSPVPISMVGDIPKYNDNGTLRTLEIPNDGASCADAQSPYSATIASEASSSISASSATLTASVNPQNLSTTATVCYSASPTTSGGALQGCTESGQAGNASTANPLIGTSSVPLDPITLSGLTPRTTYYWQVKTVSDYAITYGAVQSFTTTGVPVVTTQPVSAVGTTTATVNGIVNPGGLSTTVEFCVGTASDLTGCSSEAAAQSPLAAGTSDTSVSSTLSGLAPGTRYYARVDTTNTDGSASGNIVSFTTSAPPQATINSATDITSSDARLNATVNPQGSVTSVSFCYGTAADFTGCTPVSAAESPLIAVDANLTVTADLTGLSAATTYFVRATAANGNGTTVSNSGSFTTDPTPLVVTTTTGALTTGVVGTPYSRTLSAAGGVAPYTWSVTAGALPAGLSLNSVTGVIAGTPTTAGISSFTIGVTDGNALDDAKAFSMSVVAQPVATASAVTSVATTSATLNGAVNPGNLLTTVNFCVGTSIDLSGCTVIAADESPLAIATASSTVSAGISGLTPGTTYYARVQAANSAGGGTSPVVSFTTTAAPAVTTGAATFRDKAGEAILNASVDTRGADTTVSFCWGTTPTLVGCTSAAASQSPLSGGSSTVNVTRTVTALSLGVTYYFNVTAINAAGTTVGSTVEFTMPTSTAPTPTVTSVSPNTGDAAGGESITITGTNFSTTGIGVTVSIGGLTATVINTTSTGITVTTPPGVVGAADVIVSNNDGQAVRATGAFIYNSASFTLTYDGNGATAGAAPVDGTSYTYGSNVTVTGAGTLARAGHEFLGWNTAANGSGTTVLVGAGLTITGNTTLYALWAVALTVAPSVTPSVVSFGSLATDAGASPAQTVTITNAGGRAISVSSGGIFVTGTAASDFSISGGTCAPSGVIASGSSCTIEVVFDPSVVGTRSASVLVATTAGTVTVALSGTGTTPTPTPAPNPTPAPVLAAGPPVDVTAAPGDGRVSVSWKPPVSSGSFPITNYRMRAAPGGASCVVAVPATSCVIEGLINGVAYTVVGQALTGAGWGAASSPSAPVVPSGSAQPVPQPGRLPGPVPAGSVKVMIDGQVDPQATATADGNSAVVVVSGDYTVNAGALDPAGRVLPLGEGNQVQPMVGQRIEVSGARFHPSTYAAVYVHDPDGDASPVLGKPVIIGAVLVDDSGMFTGAWVLPDEVVAGEYVLQVVGTTMRLEALSANLGMTVQQSLDRSIRISGERMVPRALARRVFVTGVTENLDGQLVQARVKLRGETTYRQGSMRMVRDGGFSWQRRTKKKVYVYFETVSSDSERVRSNRIILRQVGR